MPALEPYAKAPRHPILENLRPEHPVAVTTSLMVSMPVTVGGVVTVVMVLVRR
jgi:hypothetical protein